MYTITLDSGDLRKALTELAQLGDRPRGIVAAAVAAVRVKLQEHFAQRNSEPNQLGGRKTGFWGDVLKSTQITELTDRYGVITIGDDRFPQKVFGGQIVQKSASKPLTIPLRAEAHGRRAFTLSRELGVKLFRIGKMGRQVLAARIGGKVVAFYALKESVNQKPDPRAMPSIADLESSAMEAAEAQLRTEIQRIQPT